LLIFEAGNSSTVAMDNFRRFDTKLYSIYKHAFVPKKNVGFGDFGLGWDTQLVFFEYKCMYTRQSLVIFLIFFIRIVSTGPVDTLWAENLNSVLDESKVLCLPNGERMQLTPNLRILFEVDSLMHTSPATVSR
jgi:hypothetical protein